jgi:hypothetical protein
MLTETTTVPVPCLGWSLHPNNVAVQFSKHWSRTNFIDSLVYWVIILHPIAK